MVVMQKHRYELFYAACLRLILLILLLLLLMCQWCLTLRAADVQHGGKSDVEGQKAKGRVPKGPPRWCEQGTPSRIPVTLYNH
jgi:hypothetical protein